MNINEALIKVQSELHAPKSQFNPFGKYNYRSCEDILTAVKPLLAEVGATITITDEIVCVESKPYDRIYVKATARFTTSLDDSIAVHGFARESLDKKGMDDSQITGATSSYARKYALNGLLLIDDTKDADGTNKHGKEHDDVNMGNATKVATTTPKTPSRGTQTPSGSDADTWTCPFGRSKGRTLLQMAEKDPADVASLHAWLVDKYDPSHKFASSNKKTIDMIQDWIDAHPEYFPKPDDGNQEEDLFAKDEEEEEEKIEF